jgi:hypothetical protein
VTGRPGGWGRTVSVSSLAPKFSPNLGPVWGEMGWLRGGHTFGAALGAVFGPVLSVWTKTDR